MMSYCSFKHLEDLENPFGQKPTIAVTKNLSIFSKENVWI
jgi:hypothetical protein